MTLSRNLVELIRRHHAVHALSALGVLKAAVDDHGEVTDEDRKHAAEVSGLPEAAVYGSSTFYDDLLQPRGIRHVRVCTGTSCFAATGNAHVGSVKVGLGLDLGRRSADGSVSLAETVCLGFCHSSPAVRDGDLIDAGVHILPLSRGADQRARGTVRGRQHLVPGVQGGRRRRPADGRTARVHARPHRRRLRAWR